MVEKTYLTWTEFDDVVIELTKRIKESNIQFDGIYGIPRGGLPLAICLSHNLNLPLLLYPTKNSLVVDDISDTGKTLKSFKNRKIACIYSSKWTETVPDFYILSKTLQDTWITFPWENAYD